MTHTELYVRERHGFRFVPAKDNPELVRLASKDDFLELIIEN